MTQNLAALVSSGNQPQGRLRDTTPKTAVWLDAQRACRGDLAPHGALSGRDAVHMEYPLWSQRRSPRTGEPAGAVAIRVEHGNAVLCGRCGCLLAPFDRIPIDGAWYHVTGAPGRDARGCWVDCLHLPHRFIEVAVG